MTVVKKKKNTVVVKISPLRSQNFLSDVNMCAFLHELHCRLEKVVYSG